MNGARTGYLYDISMVDGMGIILHSNIIDECMHNVANAIS